MPYRHKIYTSRSSRDRTYSSRGRTWRISDSEADQDPSRHRLTFYTLPREVRDQIYALTILSRQHGVLRGTTNLLTLSKQVHLESAPILHAIEQTLQIDKDGTRSCSPGPYTRIWRIMSLQNIVLKIDLHWQDDRHLEVLAKTIEALSSCSALQRLRVFVTGRPADLKKDFQSECTKKMQLLTFDSKIPIWALRSPHMRGHAVTFVAAFNQMRYSFVTTGYVNIHTLIGCPKFRDRCSARVRLQETRKEIASYIAGLLHQHNSMIEELIFNHEVPIPPSDMTTLNACMAQYKTLMQNDFESLSSSSYKALKELMTDIPHLKEVLPQARMLSPSIPRLWVNMDRSVARWINSILQSLNAKYIHTDVHNFENVPRPGSRVFPQLLQCEYCFTGFLSPGCMQRHQL